MASPLPSNPDETPQRPYLRVATRAEEPENPMWADKDGDELQLWIGDELVSSQLAKAESMFARFRGLLGRSGLAPTEALWITPCNSIHMWFMRFPIDVVFLDSHLSVVRVHNDVKPWAMRRGGKHAHSVIELPAGRAAFFNIRVGDRARIASPED